MVLTTEGVSLGNEGYRQQNQEICTAAVCETGVRGRQEGENDVRWRKESGRSERNESKRDCLKFKVAEFGLHASHARDPRLDASLHVGRVWFGVRGSAWVVPESSKEPCDVRFRALQRVNCSRVIVEARLLHHSSI